MPILCGTDDQGGTPTQDHADMRARRDGCLLIAFMIAFVVLYISFWPPPVPGIEDEVGFINQAAVWLRGAISAQGAHLQFVGDFAHVDGRDVPFRHPGRSLILVPFLLLSPNLSIVFLSSLIIHLGITLASARIFRQLGLSPLAALLVLFNPTLALYSRTVMADGAATLFVSWAIATLLASKPRPFTAGLLMGFAVTTRLQVIVILAGLLLFLLIRRKNRGAILMCAGAAVFGLPLAWYNHVLFGHLTGYQFGEGYISLSYIPENVKFDLKSLCAVWPLMFPLALMCRQRPFVLLMHLCFWPFFALLATYHHRDSTTSALETLVVGQRLMQPVIPLLIVGAVSAISNWISLTRSKKVWIAIGLAGALLTGMIFQRHQKHLRVLLAAREAIDQQLPPGITVLANSTAAKTAEILQRDRVPYRFVMIDLDENGKLPKSFDRTELSRCAAIVWLSKTPDPKAPPEVQSLADACHLHLQNSRIPGMFLWRN